MCKVMILKGVKDSKLALDFMRAVAPNMSLYNTDGIGYSAINSQNKLFSEKWHNNKQFLDTESVIDQETLEALQPFKKKLSGLALNYQPYGEVTRDDLRTVTMHTRFATCGKEFANTHPFIDHGMSLIHNGGISNCTELALNKVSTCDSENALQLYNNEQLNVATEKEQFQKFTDQLKGYWAFAFLAKGADGIYNLDLVRERASLYWAFLPELGEDCIVFATTQDIIEIGCKALGLPVRKKIFVLIESMYYRFNALNGELTNEFKLKESAMNSYKWNSKFYNADGSYKGYNKDKEDVEVVYSGNKILVEDKKTEGLGVDAQTLYEEFKAKEEENIAEGNVLQGVSDDLVVESFFDVTQSLYLRLVDYDALFASFFADAFEDLPLKVQLFLERKEEEDYINFDDIIKIMESYIDTESVNSIYTAYARRKRA